MHLEQIDRVATITKEDFLKNYFKPQRPVIIERIDEDWPAFEKWDLDYMAKVAGDVTIFTLDTGRLHEEQDDSVPARSIKFATARNPVKR